MARPKKNTDLRTAQVPFYVTKADAEYLNRVASDLGFSSRSQFLTALIERLIIGGFSARVFAQLGRQVAGLADEKMPDRQLELYLGIRPLPPLLGETEEQLERWVSETINDVTL